MKNYTKRVALLTAIIMATCYFKVSAVPAAGSYYKLKIYHYKTPAQYQALSNYLQQAYVPAMHRLGFKSIGVLHTMEKDTADRRVYVFIPFNNLGKIEDVDEKLSKDKLYIEQSKGYTNAIYNAAPYSRLEIVILKAFTGMPKPEIPLLAAAKSDRIYELRSYESATEKYHINKVDMFNAGDEIGIFNRLGFNAVFYSSVIAGSRMPNLMYMVVFVNMDEREKHWNTFRDDAQWKKLSPLEGYKNNVSHIDNLFLQAAEYSDF